MWRSAYAMLFNGDMSVSKQLENHEYSDVKCRFHRLLVRTLMGRMLKFALTARVVTTRVWPYLASLIKHERACVENISSLQVNNCIP